MKKDSLLKSTSLFSLATMVSRVLGVIRDSAISACVPAMWQDIFWAGFKIPSTFRMLFAEGALSAVFIPLLTRVREREGEAKAHQLASAIFTLLCMSLLVVTVLAIVLAPWFVPHLLDFKADDAVAQLNPADLGVAGILADTADWRDAAGVRATQVMFPFLFFIALSAWAMGVLNTYRYFFMPAVASAFFNAILIVGCLIGPRYFDNMNLICFLGTFVVFGGFLQFAVQVPQARAIGYFPPRFISPFQPMVKEFMVKLAPGIFGLAVYQINALVSQMYFASKYGNGAISIMQYAFRFIQFPLGVIGVALAAASFPRIAQYVETRQTGKAAHTLEDVLKYLLLLMIPAAVGLAVLGQDIIGLIYDRGEFHRENWLQPTTMVLLFYSLGLFFYSLLKVLIRTIQAHHDFWTPVWFGLISMAANILLCVLFVAFALPLWSLALASALASALQGVLLLVNVRLRLPLLRLVPVGLFAAKVLLASAGMGVLCYACLWVFPIQGGSFFGYLMRVLAGMGVGVGSYALCGWLLFWDELKVVMKIKTS